jgi:3-oxoacyl-[acyl-carrier protein] reductase
VVAADVDAAGGRETERTIRTAGGEATFVETDVTRAADAARLVHAALEVGGGRIDVLVNAAGVLRYGYVEDLAEADWDLTIDVSLKGTFLCCRAVLPTMKAQRDGVIVNISSSGARSYPEHYPAYVAAKTGILGLTQSMARALRPHRVSVLAICPTAADTPMGRQAFLERHGRPPHDDELARSFATPEEMARVIVALASPDMRQASGSGVDTLAFWP